MRMTVKCYSNYTLSGAIIEDFKSWDPRAPMIWDNFSIFRAKCATLMTYICADPRTYGGFSRGCCHVAWSNVEGYEPRTVKRIVTVLMLRVFFRCFSLFRNLSPREKIVKLSSFWDWWAESLFVSIIVAKYNIFPRADSSRSSEKKLSGEAICSRHQRALSGFWARLRILNLIAWLC